MFNGVEYLKDVYELYRQLYQVNMSDKEASKCFDFQAAERISFDATSPSMAIIFDGEDFFGIDTPFGRFHYKFGFIMKKGFGRALKDKVVNVFDGEIVEDLSNFVSLTCANPEIYSIRKLPWRYGRLSRVKYPTNKEGCLTKTEIEAILEPMNEYIESFDKPPVINNVVGNKRGNIFDVLFHKKNNKKK